MGKTGRKNRIYLPEFKIDVIMDMREHRLGYCETVRKYNLGSVRSGAAIAMLQTRKKEKNKVLHLAQYTIMKHNHFYKTRSLPVPPTNLRGIRLGGKQEYLC